jgi:hypothetical protein
MGKNIWWFALIAIVLLLGQVDAGVFASDDSEPGSFTLEGIKNIYVRVAMDPEIETKGLGADQLKKDTEQQLREAGIKILNEGDFSRLKGSVRYPLAGLDVIITLIDIQEMELDIYDIEVKIRQVVFLARRPVIKILAPTWKDQTVFQSNSLGLIREKLKESVDKFLDAYLSVNPK